jgi:hypothetical protein
MQLIVLIVLCFWAVYTSQRFIPFSIKLFNNDKKQIVLEFPKKNITLNITFREPAITLPKFYLDDMHQVIMMFQ